MKKQEEKPKQVEFGPADNYTKEFILKKAGLEGARKWATSVELSASGVAQFIDQKYRASRDLIASLEDLYPDFDVKMALNGKSTEKPTAQVEVNEVAIFNVEVLEQLKAKDVIIAELAQQLKESREDAKLIQQQMVTVLDELREYTKDFRDMAKSNFTESSSHTTAYTVPQYDSNQQRMVIDGFKQGNIENSDARLKIMQMQLLPSVPFQHLQTINCFFGADGNWYVPAQLMAGK